MLSAGSLVNRWHHGAMLGAPILIDDHGEQIDALTTIASEERDGGVSHRVTVTLAHATRLNRVEVDLDLRVGEMIEHGFQSWSTVRRTSPGDVRPERAEAPRWFRSQMLADRDSAGRTLCGDTFLVHDRGVVGFLTAKQSFGSIVVQPDGAARAVWLFDDVTIGPGSVQLDPLWIATGDPGPLYSTYARLAGKLMAARAPRPLPRGWCSWYQYFTDVTADDVRSNLAVALDHGLDVIQIDDGWQREIGVWGEMSPRFGAHIVDLAREIRAGGTTAGVWTAPFLAIEGGQVAQEHPEWLVRNDRGLPTTALHHGGWGGRIFALDTTHPDVLAHIEATYRQLRTWGFDYFKIDFCHAGAAVGTRHDPSVTRAQALRRGLEAVRAGIGDDAYLLGCGCPLLSAVGVVDAMRVSEDVAPHWEPRLFFGGWPESTVAARNAVEASCLRAPLNDRWFTLDPDCVLLRDAETELTQQERRILAVTALATGGFVVISDDLHLYGDVTWAEYESMVSQALGGPREIVDPFAPQLEIVWGDARASVDWEQRVYELDD
jgi:alpha-galactosidase